MVMLLAGSAASAKCLCKLSQGVSAETPGRVPRGVETGLTGRYGRWVIDLIHPGHLASQGVARAAGLSPTTGLRDGEVRWISRPAAVP
jgi:hypothetical protein